MTPLQGIAVLTYDDGGTVRPFVALTDAALSFSTRMLPVAPEVEAGWDDFIPGDQGWSVSASHMKMLDGASRAAAQKRLDRLAHDRTRFEVVFTTPYGAVYTGDVYVEEWDVQAGGPGSVMLGNYSLRGAGPCELAET